MLQVRLGASTLNDWKKKLSEDLIKEFTGEAIGSVQLSFIDVVIGILITYLLTTCIRIFYQKRANTVSNRNEFSKNFFLIGGTIFLVISVIKSSLALSLGLVGALSIVRFRTAIKEPEELSYLFFVIAVGLGIGANQIIPTIVATLSILCIIYLKGLKDELRQDKSYNFKVIFNTEKLSLTDVIEVLSEKSILHSIVKFEKAEIIASAIFFVNFGDPKKLEEITEALSAKDSTCEISYYEPFGGL